MPEWVQDEKMGTGYVTFRKRITKKDVKQSGDSFDGVYMLNDGTQYQIHSKVSGNNKITIEVLEGDGMVRWIKDK